MKTIFLKFIKEYSDAATPVVAHPRLLMGLEAHSEFLSDEEKAVLINSSYQFAKDYTHAPDSVKQSVIFDAMTNFKIF